MPKLGPLLTVLGLEKRLTLHPLTDSWGYHLNRSMCLIYRFLTRILGDLKST